MRWLLLAGAAAGGWTLTRLMLVRPPKALFRPPHLRTNYRGREVAGTLGILLTLPVGVAGFVVGVGWDTRIGWGSVWRDGAVAAAAGLVMGGLGVLDDLKGRSRGGGFAGHLRALVGGHVTTGLVKAVGGGVVGLVAAWALGLRGAWIIAGGAVVALSANLFNLLDLRPGRTIKAWLASWMALLFATPPAGALVVSAALAGGAIGFFPSDLRERAMLGDGGANLLGAVFGVAAVASLGGTAILVLLGALVVLTAASELVSFTRVIERVPPLRALDQLGRRKD